MGKIKIFNDPVYGFVRIPRDILFSIVEHSYFQRLRRIKQLGLTDLVYPGAHHSRFHHTLGAVHLMTEALENIRLKGVEISDEEMEAAQMAILLHDIGHGPFSHALENRIIIGGSHEDISLAFMKFFNTALNGRLNLALKIFKGEYERPFLNQLVSGQLDVDRLDYLRRDSFYTGVSEGVIGSDRIIKMMNVVDDELVIDEKGIYSIEKFLIARNLMYWQVYLHKTVIAAEMLLVKILERAVLLNSQGHKLTEHESLKFLLNQLDISELESKEVMDSFSSIDDTDIIMACKAWMQHEDPILAKMCTMLIDRQLPRVELRNGKLNHDYLQCVQKAAKEQLNLSDEEMEHYVLWGEVSNTTYQNERSIIKILLKKGGLVDFTKASEQYDLNVLNKQVQKHYICYPKSLRL